MEEDAVLVVGEGIIYFLVPYDTSIGRRYVDQLEPECVPHRVVCQHNSALQSSVGPSVLVGIGNVQLGNGDGVDLVRRLGNGALHRLLVFVG